MGLVAPRHHLLSAGYLAPPKAAREGHEWDCTAGLVL